MDERATVWYREVCGGVQWLLCDEGFSRDFSTWGVWDDGYQEKIYWPKYYKVNSIESLFQGKEAGVVYTVLGDLDGNKYKIQCMKEADYIMKLFRTHGSLSKQCRKTSCNYKNRGERVTKIFLS